MKRKAMILSAATLLLTGGLMLAPLSASAMPSGNATLTAQPGELVVNGDAEVGDTSGWTNGLSVRGYGVGGYPNAVKVNSSGSTGDTFNGGARFFSGSGGASSSTQTIDLSPSATAIDTGTVTADASAILGGWLNQGDRAQVRFDFEDASSSVLQNVTLGYVTNADRGNTSGFVSKSDELVVPAGTRSVVVTIETIRTVAPANDGYVDNVSLILSAPAPTATADNPTTVADTPVSFDPTANDTAVGPATIDSTSVRLLDGSGNPVTTLTNSDGVYTVDTATGDITFTPAGGFTGTTTPISYRVADSTGQTADAAITVTVGPVVGVAMFNGRVGAVALALLIFATGGFALMRRRRLATVNS